MTTRVVLLLLGCCMAVMAAPRIETESQIWKFMEKYGYISPKDLVNGLPKNNAVRRQSIIYFQKMGNKTMTGELDSDSMELMNMPRCGMKDMESFADMMRKKRYALGSRWTRTDLTWRLINRTADLPGQDVDRIMRDALKAWSDVSALTFREVTSGRADIEIFFVSGLHGDGPNGAFDGPSGVLAHAYFPSFNPIGGDAHFDEDETYTDGTFSGINLFQVAAHEFGHSLGLRHSDVEDALMYPYYRGYVPNFQLHSDDIAGIQAHYGEGNGIPEEMGTPSTPTNDCMPQIDWATRTEDGSAYFGNGTHVFRRVGNTIPGGYPMRIATEFPGLPNNVDAALFWNPYTYFFKGDEYWRFRNRETSSAYPRPITDWNGLPSDIDSAYQWSRNGGIYFTKGNEYYRYYPGYGVLTSYYPQPLSQWRGLPADGVDGAFQYSNGITYFFKGPNYYRFDDAAVRVMDGYPLNTAIQWLGCDPNQLVVGPTTDMGGDAAAAVPSMIAVLFSALAALLYSF